MPSADDAYAQRLRYVDIAAQQVYIHPHCFFSKTIHFVSSSLIDLLYFLVMQTLLGSLPEQYVLTDTVNTETAVRRSNKRLSITCAYDKSPKGGGKSKAV